MRNKFKNIIRGACFSVLLVATASPVLAQSRADRARVAIAEARAKVDAAVKVGATGEAPALIAQAEARLREAREQFARSKETDAIDLAHSASALADQALGVAERNKTDAAVAERDRRVDAEATVAVQAQRNEALIEQRDTAVGAAARAEQSAEVANDRANAAEQSANNASLDAANARAQAAAAPTTTVTVERETRAATPAYSRKATTTRRPAAKPKRKAVRTTTTTTRPATEKTTTTITTEPPR